MASFGPTELFVLNFVGIQEELGKLFGAHGSVLEYWVSQKNTGGATSNSGLYGVVRMATHEEALTAKKALNKEAFNGRVLTVKWAQNQRVLWIGHLGPRVTNEVLQAAFAQFGAVQRAVVAAEPTSSTSRRYGFVTFERKDDAQRALAMCRQNQFLVGASPMPALVELARIEARRCPPPEDVDEGYNDEMAGHGKEKREREPMMPPTGLPAHFSMAGTAEHAIAAQACELQKQYLAAKRRLRMQLDTATQARSMSAPEQALLAPHRAPAPGTLAHAHTPPDLLGGLGAGLGGGMGGAGAMLGGVPGGMLGGVPGGMLGVGGSGGGGRGGGGGAAVHAEDFHHVAPPKRLRMSDGQHDRYFDRPRHGDAFSAPPPDLAFGSGGPAPPLAAARPAAFISGGQLRSVLDGGGAGGGAGAGASGWGGVPQGFHGGQRGPVGGIADGGGAGQQAAMAMPPPQADAASGVGEGRVAAHLPGAKPPGSHDHGGIGFGGPGGHDAPPSAQAYGFHALPSAYGPSPAGGPPRAGFSQPPPLQQGRPPSGPQGYGPYGPTPAAPAGSGGSGRNMHSGFGGPGGSHMGLGPPEFGSGGGGGGGGGGGLGPPSHMGGGGFGAPAAGRGGYGVPLAGRGRGGMHGPLVPY